MRHSWRNYWLVFPLKHWWICKVDYSVFTNFSYTFCRFTDIPQSDGNTQFTYSYNPCVAYYDGGACAYGTAAVSFFKLLYFDLTQPHMQACQTSYYTDYYMLGDASTETMYTDSDNNNNYLQYDNGDDNRYKYVHCLSTLILCMNVKDPVTMLLTVYSRHGWKQYACVVLMRASISLNKLMFCLI